MDDGQTQDAPPTTAEIEFEDHKMVRISIVGIFLILFIGMLYFAQGLLMPVTLAFLAALVLSPVVRSLHKRGVPEGLSALCLVLALAAAIVVGGYTLSGPVTALVEDAPSIGWELRYKLASLREPFEKVKNARQLVDDATKEDPEPGVEEVIVREPGLLNRAAEGLPEVLAGAGLALVLLLFLLASGDLFFEKLVKALPTLQDRKRALRIAQDVEREVSRYLLTISVINAVLGVLVGTGLYVIGMPNPLLWGVLVAALNFVPYLGAVIGIGLVSIVALVSFPTLGQAAMAPGIYLVLTLVEGQVLTPMLVGKRLQINAVAVFLAIAFWGWMWGFIGVLIAVPILIVIKVFASRVEDLSGLNEFLSERGVTTAPPPG